MRKRSASKDEAEDAENEVKSLDRAWQQKYITWYNEDAAHLETGLEKSSVNGFVVQRHQVLELQAVSTEEEEELQSLEVKDHDGNRLGEDDIFGNRIKFSISDYELIRRKQFVGSDFVLLATGYSSEIRKKDALSTGKIESVFLANPTARYILISKSWEGVPRLVDFKPAKMPKGIAAKVKTKRTPDYTFYFRKDNCLGNRRESVKVTPGTNPNIMVCLERDYGKVREALGTLYYGYVNVKVGHKKWKRKRITGVGIKEEIEHLIKGIKGAGISKVADNTLYFTRRKSVPTGFINPYEVLQVRFERLRARIGVIPKKAFYASNYESQWNKAAKIPFFGARLVPEYKSDMIGQFNRIAKAVGEKGMPAIQTVYDDPRSWEYRQLRLDKRHDKLMHRLRLVRPPRPKR